MFIINHCTSKESCVDQILKEEECWFFCDAVFFNVSPSIFYALRGILSIYTVSKTS